MAGKKCFKCGTEKKLSEYYKHSAMSDGHLNKCKECAKKDVSVNREIKIDYYRNYDKARGNRQPQGYFASYRDKYPKKYFCMTSVSNAIRDGRLKRKPCEVCGIKKTHGHHDDYLKPLDVRWLCAAHHKQWHKKNGPGLNGDTHET